MWRPKLMSIPGADKALPGREQALQISGKHYVNGREMSGECPAQWQSIMVGMGCFWGAERLFWQLPGVMVTAVGYAGGATHNPHYKEVCSGQTGHAEVVRIWFDPQQVSLEQLLQVFWQRHDPTQGMRQGNDVGTQYRSAIYVNDAEQMAVAQQTMVHYQQRLTEAGLGEITTELALLNTPFYFAEEEHQQYLAKHPNGYCGLSGCSVDY